MDFLNTLIDIYNNETIEDNRMEMLNTQHFIRGIHIINEELVEVGKGGAVQAKPGLTDLETDAP